MKLIILKVAIFLCILSLYSCDNEQNDRWYNKEQVKSGQVLYRQNCQQCHGQKGVGTTNWRTPLKDGTFPPPPLNGSAHTWHHSIDVLSARIREGGRKMPAFKTKLKDEEIMAVLAYIQSLWPEITYRTWSKRNKVDHFVKALSYFDHDEMRTKIFLLDMDGSGSSDKDAARAIEHSFNQTISLGILSYS